MKKLFLNNLVYGIIFGITFSAGCKEATNALLRVAGREVGEKIAEKILTPKTSKKPPESDWKRFQIGSSDLFIDCPGEIKPMEINLPVEVRRLYQKFENYRYSRDTGFEMIAAAALAVSGVKTDLHGAYEGAVTNMSRSRGVSEFQHIKKTVIVSGREGFVMSGTLKFNGMPAFAKGLFIADGQNLWTVILTYVKNDTEELIAQRIIDSVKIESSVASEGKTPVQGEEGVRDEGKYMYTSEGKRDPFRSLILGMKEMVKLEEERKRIEEEEEEKRFVEEREKIPFTPLQRFDLASIKVVAIIWGDIGRYAMVEAPDGKGYTIRKGTYIGKSRGIIRKITNETITVEEKYKDVDKKVKTRIVELKLKKEE